MQLFHKKFSLLILLAGTIIMIFIMLISGKPLNTSETPCGILHLEFANTEEKVLQVLSAWKKNSSNTNDIIAAAKGNTWFDFLFLLFYALFLYSSCYRLSRMVTNKIISSLLSFFAIAALLAGGLDMLENIGMLLSLSGQASHAIALFTSIVSIIKWVLVLGAITSLIVGILVFIFQRKTKMEVV